MNTDQINALVAEKVMGWGNKPGYWKVPLWSPATDMNHAMEVADRMIDLGWWFSLVQDNVDIWDACVFSRDNMDGDQRHYGFNISAPLAICLAALKTVGVEPPAC